jgi:hypothetical protein
MKTYICVDRETGRCVGTWGPSEAAPPPADAQHAFVDAADFPTITPRDTFTSLAPTKGDARGLYGGVLVKGDSPVAVAVKRLSLFEFMSLLTPQERIALRARAASDPIMGDSLVMLELASPMVSQMLGYVQQMGLMSPERRADFEAAVANAAY